MPVTATSAQASAKTRKVRRVPTSGISRSAEAKVPTRLPAVEIAYMRPGDGAALLDAFDASRIA